jgi:methyl-accepting chemotaxis protein
MLKSMSISAKLYLAMLIAVALSLGMAATAYDQLAKVSDRVEVLTSRLYDDLAAIDETNTSLNRILDQRRDVLIQLEDTRNLIIIGSVASFLFFALLAAYLVRNHVVAPVTQLSRLLQDVAGTLDFTRRHRHDMNDEFGSASEAFNQLMDETGTALRQLSQNTTQVAGGASQASSAIGQVAEGAQVQIDDLNQIAEAMQQTSQSIGDAARTTREASQQAASAARLVEDGHQRMATLMQAARGIEEDSKRINRISDAITRIASETHMLSLNASIEAARAGEHGKGFAVVAEQVGQLAEDAAQSAQEIQALVKQVEADATRSLNTAERFEQAMNEISHHVSESDAMVRSVAAAVEEQRASVARIEVNVGSLREIGQGNATAAEEITATMIELSKLAQRSREQVDRFKTD